MTTRQLSSLPPGPDADRGMPIGIGLRSAHYEHILAERPEVAWFEVLSDNYMNTRGRPLAYLDRIAERYPVVLHGVGLSLGSVDPLDRGYLAELRQLRDRVQAPWVSDHIAWTGVDGRYGHDLYPVPFTEECLRHMARRVCQVQDELGSPLVLENPSTYLQLHASTLSEPEFIAGLLEETGAALLLDVNNLFVNAHNHGFDPLCYLRHLPLDRVVQVHLAGHDQAEVTGPDGAPATLLIDTHGGRVAPEVWQLFEQAVALGLRAPVLLEWDSDIPPFPVVQREALRARHHIDRALTARPPLHERAHPRDAREPNRPRATRQPIGLRPLPAQRSLAALQRWFFERVTSHAPAPEGAAATWHHDDQRLVRGGVAAVESRIAIYDRGYLARLVECLRDDYPAVAFALGPATFDALCTAFIKAHPPASPSLSAYGARFPAFCATRPGPFSTFASELATLEWAVVESIHAATGPALDARALADLPPAAWGHVSLIPSPALRIVHATHPVQRYYRAFLDDEPTPIPDPEPTTVIVCRRGNDVWRREVAPEHTLLLERLVAGQPLAAALDTLDADSLDAPSSEAATVALQRAFSEWVACGLFAGIRLAREQRAPETPNPRSCVNLSHLC